MRAETQLPPQLRGLRIPAVAAPMFIVSVPELFIAQCTAGIIGSFPALNAREGEGEPRKRQDAWCLQSSPSFPSGHPSSSQGCFATLGPSFSPKGRRQNRSRSAQCTCL